VTPLWIQFAILGVFAGALIALPALGIVIIHRGSGVVNFAQGAIAMVGAYVFYGLHIDEGMNYFLAGVIGVAASGLVGVLSQLLVMRPLRNAPPVSRLMASLGILTFLEQLMSHIVSPSTLFVPSGLPTSNWTIFGTSVGENEVYIAIIVAVVALALGGVYQYTQLGRATRAALENRRAISALGYSPDRIAVANWLIGGCLAGLAGVLIAPIVGLSVSTYTLLVLPALAACVIGGVNSLGLAILGSVVIGIIQSEMTLYISAPGWTDAAPFFLVIVVLLLSKAPKVSRSSPALRLPRVGSGRLRPQVIVPILCAALLIIQFWLGIFWLSALVTTAGAAIVLLSFVIVTGYSGQLSLAQFGFAGLGAWIAGKLLVYAHWPFPLAAICGVLFVLPLGLLLGMICLRTRGVNLVIATLGLAVCVENLVFDSPTLTGAFGINIGSPSLFGLNVGSIQHPNRYAALAVVALALAAVVTGNVRRGASGRRMLAARANERAAASLGLQTTQAKVFAFALGSAVAALGGIVIGFANSYIEFTNFSTLPSISAVAQSVVGGVGWIPGSIIGGIGQVGGVLTQALDQWVGYTLAGYIPLFGAVLLIFVLIGQPDGAAAIMASQLKWLKTRFDRVVGGSRIREKRVSSHAFVQVTNVEITRVRSAVLSVKDITVAFGGVTAVNGMSLEVRPGEVVGLIGPNGAGKTTVIDAIAGYVSYRSGKVTLDGVSLDHLKASSRARLGLTRSFQSLELFDDLTVFDNLATASDPRGLSPFLTDIVYPRPARLSDAASAAIPEFGLSGVLDMTPSELPYSTRRLVAIARAVATNPSVLLLDEPAAGLDERETSELGELVSRLAREWGMGVLLVEHDVAMVMGVCDRVYAMELGQLIASGTPAEVRRHEDVVRSYLGASEGAE
jgi:ABC-type branched-subunit amino acid transport system ATPase component/branched-subunit amino acid ABC-type transport system permease component